MQTLTKKSLFWDVAKVDPRKNEKFIIERILNYGDEADFRWARESYGDKIVKETLLKSQALDNKSLSFWCQYFNLDQNKCLKNQSTKKQGWFWKR
ncbi:MAG: hypothetical protein A2927_00450 [Candidatus Komeilibacteria bacterium RIFCSPLOWO2_01_FULL_45_10]|uniref:DUF6922 domain-containing protein n=1 Tax=Candidatus Komeilibacteria bacterium RIFCSPLOWO2_01_FULL_45_10 TaxID=1798550 RepID=A0A1G2BLT7_9BACT|nr:MAG: hypothetical protein A2927_00450 [Candidatus Komeilibacteria bacterium RIFCSPLOWO2_01_FULL_45_10]